MRAKKIISINNIIVAAIKKMMGDLTSNILTKDLYKMPVRHIFNLGVKLIAETAPLTGDAVLIYLSLEFNNPGSSEAYESGLDV